MYEPLQAVLDHCTERPPHVLLLLGPFVDAEHPLVQAGTLQDSFDDIFATQVHDLLNTFALLCKCLHKVPENGLPEQIGIIYPWPRVTCLVRKTFT